MQSQVHSYSSSALDHRHLKTMSLSLQVSQPPSLSAAGTTKLLGTRQPHTSFPRLPRPHTWRGGVTDRRTSWTRKPRLREGAKRPTQVTGGRGGARTAPRGPPWSPCSSWPCGCPVRQAFLPQVCSPKDPGRGFLQVPSLATYVQADRLLQQRERVLPAWTGGTSATGPSRCPAWASALPDGQGPHVRKGGRL